VIRIPNTPQSDLTSRALDSLSGENNTLENNLDFQGKALEILKQWVPTGNPLLLAIKESIGAEVEAVRKKALNKVEQKIRIKLLNNTVS